MVKNLNYVGTENFRFELAEGCNTEKGVRHIRMVSEIKLLFRFILIIQDRKQKDSEKSATPRERVCA